MAARHRLRRNFGARITDFLLDGLEAVALENERLRVGVLAGRGADVFEFLHKPTDVDFCWLGPRGARPDSTASFLDSYAGGWQEVLPNGGAPSEHDGASFDQHGEVCMLPWDWEVVDDGPERVSVRFVVRARKLPLRLERVMTLARAAPRLEVAEQLVNESGVTLSAMWGQHIAFGPPFLEPGARIALAAGARVIPHPRPVSDAGRRLRGDAESAWPAAVAEDGGEEDLATLPSAGSRSEMLYVTDLPEGAYELRPPRRGPAFRLEWDTSVWPYLWIWQELGASRGHPWYGRTYLLGLEPFSSYPTDGLAAAVRNGTAMRVEPRADVRVEWSAEVLEDVPVDQEVADG